MPHVNLLKIGRLSPIALNRFDREVEGARGGVANGHDKRGNCFMVSAGESLHRCNSLRGQCRRAWIVLLPLLGVMLLLGACMTPERARRESDAAAERLATHWWQEQFGSTNTFDFTQPGDALALRIALLAIRSGAAPTLPQIPHLQPTLNSNGAVELTLTDTLCLAARNDRGYQNLKEAVFNAALDLDYQQYQFETTFTGMMLGVLSGEPELERASGRAAGGVSRKFENGAEIVGGLAVDVVSLLRDDWRSTTLTGDLTMALPLMRGSGREIVREPLTQAERNLHYAICNFEHYRQTYAVGVAQTFYGVLEAFQRVQNALDNEKNLAENSRRAEMMFKAGRMARIQVDQARTDLLSANKSVIDTKKNFEVALDALKMKIGLPPESLIEADVSEVERLGDKVAQWADSDREATAMFPTEEISCEIALTERFDLTVLRGKVEDNWRAVKVAADALRADVTLTGSGHHKRARASGESKFVGNESWDAGLRIDLPWRRRLERNQYRKSQLVLDQARRNLELQEDVVKQSVRAGLRNLVAARASYINQMEALKVARLRVESNRLFLESGRSSMRDVLEAQQALLAARNALSSVVINWQMSELELRRDMGILKISESGLWLEANGNDNG